MRVALSSLETRHHGRHSSVVTSPVMRLGAKFTSAGVFGADPLVRLVCLTCAVRATLFVTLTTLRVKLIEQLVCQVVFASQLQVQTPTNRDYSITALKAKVHREYSLCGI